jgi:hypothetical protein
LVGTGLPDLPVRFTMPIWITYDTVTLQTGNCIVATARFSEYAAATAARLKSRLKCGVFHRSPAERRASDPDGVAPRLGDGDAFPCAALPSRTRG